MKTFDIRSFAKEKMIICAHRGVWTGNIPCNSLPAYDIALAQGADMIETDVTASADGELFIFHPTQEKRQLGLDIDIRTMPASEVKRLPMVTLDGTPTEHTLLTLDELFEHLKGRCYINVDKFGDNPELIVRKIQKHNIADQIIVKSPPKASSLDVMESLAPEIQYLAIIGNYNSDYHAELMSRKMNYVGLEVVFAQDDAYIASDEFIERVHNDGRLIWGNSILYNYKKLLAAEHSDDTALTRDMDIGWGYFARKNFDIVQTDWPLALSLYLEKTGQMYKK